MQQPGRGNSRSKAQKSEHTRHVWRAGQEAWGRELSTGVGEDQDSLVASERKSSSFWRSLKDTLASLIGQCGDEVGGGERKKC